MLQKRQTPSDTVADIQPVETQTISAPKFQIEIEPALAANINAEILFATVDEEISKVITDLMFEQKKQLLTSTQPRDPAISDELNNTELGCANLDNGDKRYFGFRSTQNQFNQSWVENIDQTHKSVCLFCLELHDSQNCRQSACIGCGSIEHTYKDCDQIENLQNCSRCQEKSHADQTCNILLVPTASMRDVTEQFKIQLMRNSTDLAICIACDELGHNDCRYANRELATYTLGSPVLGNNSKKLEQRLPKYKC